MSRRELGEALLWLSIAVLLVTAGSVRALTGNQFVAALAAGALALTAGLFLFAGGRGNG